MKFCTEDPVSDLDDTLSNTQPNMLATIIFLVVAHLQCVKAQAHTYAAITGSRPELEPHS